MAGYDKYTKLLLHCDSSPFFDSALGKVVTVNGNLTLTSSPQVSAGFGDFADTGTGYFSFSTSTDFEFDANDFTVDLWAQMAAYPGSGYSKTFYSYGEHVTGGTFFDIQIAANGTITMTNYNGSGYMYQLQTTATFPLAQWNHIAGVRNGNNLYLFLNGSLVNGASGTYAGSYFPTGQTPIFGFGASLDVGFVGYLDELRISNGIARWNAPFTSSTSEYKATNKYPFPPFNPTF